MSYNVVLDPPAVATGRTQLALNSGALRVDHDGIDWGDADIQEFMADMAVGSAPVDYRLPNRTIAIPLGVGMDYSGSFDTVRSHLEEKVALFQREGGFLQRGAGLYADIVKASLTFPDQWGEAGGVQSGVRLTLEALPDFYGDEVVLDTLAGSGGDLAALLALSGSGALIGGVHPGRVEITVGELSGQTQHGLIWGFRSRYYDSATTAKLAYEAEAMTPLATSTVASDGSASAGQLVRHTALSGNWVEVLSTDLQAGGPLTHTGTYRMWVRARTTGSAQVRLLWGVGTLANPEINDFDSIPAANQWYLLDLGEVRLDPIALGQFTWSGHIQAAGSGQIDVDRIYLQPIAESAGRVLGYRQTLAVGQTAPAVLYPNRSAAIAWNGAWALGNNGTSWMPLPNVIGDRPRIPVAGMESRPVELFLKLTRGDFDTQPDGGLDAFNVSVRYRPSYLMHQ